MVTKFLKRITNKKKDDTLWHKRTLAIFVGIGIIAFWRGAWGLMDELLLPGNHLWSLWLSVFLGISILFATHSISRQLL